MGCAESSICVGSRRSIPFRCRNSTQWAISAEQWNAFVQRAYSPEVLRHASMDVDCDRVQMNLTTTEIGDYYIVAREVYMGSDFISFGRVLVRKDYWRTLAGVWIADDFGPFTKEEYRIEAVSDGGLVCTATGVQAQEAEFVETAFRGTGHRLVDKEHLGELEFGVHEGDTRKGSVIWRKSAAGHAEIFARTPNGISKWVPAEVRFNGYEELSVFHNGLKVGTFTRQIPKDPDCRNFDGSDWIFGEENVHWSEVLTQKGASYMSFHFAHVDEENQVLRVLMSQGFGGRGRPASLVVPIPAAKVAETKQHVEKWDRFKTTLFWRGSAYYGSSVRRLATSYPLLDHSLRVYCVVLLASSFATMDTATASLEGGGVDGSGGDAGGDGGFFGGF